MTLLPTEPLQTPFTECYSDYQSRTAITNTHSLFTTAMITVLTLRGSCYSIRCQVFTIERFKGFNIRNTVCIHVIPRLREPNHQIGTHPHLTSFPNHLTSIVPYRVSSPPQSTTLQLRFLDFWILIYTLTHASTVVTLRYLP